jgi:hypothetical protein
MVDKMQHESASLTISVKFFTALDPVADGATAGGLSRRSPDQGLQLGRQCRAMVNPQFKPGKPTMFICGDHDQAKAVVRGILDQFGWETADMGKAEAAPAIEPLCVLWCIPGFMHNDWYHAFRLLGRE